MSKLKYEDVKRRIESASPEVLDDLWTLGQALYRDVTERFAKHDSKASAVAGYSAGLLTLLV